MLCELPHNASRVSGLDRAWTARSSAHASICALVRPQPGCAAGGLSSCSKLLRCYMLTAEKQRDGVAGASFVRTLPWASMPAGAARGVVIPPEEIHFPLVHAVGRRSIRRRLAAILGADIRGYSIL